MHCFVIIIPDMSQAALYKFYFAVSCDVWRIFAFSTLTFFIWLQEEHLTYKKYNLQTFRGHLGVALAETSG